jgi:hypothetical protein
MLRLQKYEKCSQGYGGTSQVGVFNLRGAMSNNESTSIECRGVVK